MVAVDRYTVPAAIMAAICPGALLELSSTTLSHEWPQPGIQIPPCEPWKPGCQISRVRAHLACLLAVSQSSWGGPAIGSLVSTQPQGPGRRDAQDTEPAQGMIVPPAFSTCQPCSEQQEGGQAR